MGFVVTELPYKSKNQNKKITNYMLFFIRNKKLCKNMNLKIIEMLLFIKKLIN